MTVYDTRNTSRYEIEDDIVESVMLCMADEFVANAGGSFDEAAKAIAQYYTEGEDMQTIDPPMDHDGRELNVYRYAYGYFERHCDNA